MRLMQVARPGEGRGVVATENGSSWFVAGAKTIHALARRAISEGETLEGVVRAAARERSANPAELLRMGHVLSPVEHPDPAHLVISGTGLTHLGSAATRDAMHQKLAASDESALTDSMKMFRMGVDAGKPTEGTVGVQPEWFYKGDGSTLVRPGAPLVAPSFAEDAGEEPEVAGIYLVGEGGTPYRLGFALCNEFSDHVMERQNYLWLAHSKLRPCSVGPELLLGELPQSVEGVSRIRRGGNIIFEKAFLTGEANMSHSIANLEAHHFKYSIFRQPGDVHVHTFGTATLSFADGVRTQAGDIFEIEAPDFGLPLTNTLAVVESGPVRVVAL